MPTNTPATTATASLKARLYDAYGDLYVVTQRAMPRHGEPGEEVTLRGTSHEHTFWFADDRRITTGDKVRIIDSYLKRGQA